MGYAFKHKIGSSEVDNDEENVYLNMRSTCRINLYTVDVEVFKSVVLKINVRNNTK